MNLKNIKRVWVSIQFYKLKSFKYSEFISFFLIIFKNIVITTHRNIGNETKPSIIYWLNFKTLTKKLSEIWWKLINFFNLESWKEYPYYNKTILVCHYINVLFLFIIFYQSNIYIHACINIKWIFEWKSLNAKKYYHFTVKNQNSLLFVILFLFNFYYMHYVLTFFFINFLIHHIFLSLRKLFFKMCWLFPFIFKWQHNNFF